MAVASALVIVLGATATILHFGRLANRSPFSFSRLDYINAQSRYQLLLLVVAGIVLGALYAVSPGNLASLLGVGDVAATAAPVPWLGIGEGESWCRLGASLAIVITLATSAFIFLQFRRLATRLERLWPLLPWVLLFSLTNSFAEEVIYRLGVIVPLAGIIDPGLILLASAIAFGLPHFRGMPNGVAGVLMSGFMGWLLAKSVLETGGLFWAWLIHFLQDVVIISALALAAEARSTGRDPGA